MKEHKVVYKEPANYFPDEIQKEFKIGKYYEESDEENAEDKKDEDGKD